MVERQNMARRQPRVLQLLDDASPQLYHYIGIGIAGLGMFTDAYDLFNISLVTDLLGRIYYPQDYNGVLPFLVNAVIVGIAFCGAVVGQLVFGWLGDKVGRRPVYGLTLMLMAIFSIACGFSFRGPRENVVATLCFFRFWLGFSIGGDYPLSATIMAEYANKKIRGAFMASIFAMQGLGILVASVVAIIVSTAFEHTRSYQHDRLGQADYVWRIILMFGALPAILTYYWRMKMPETARYTALVTGNAKLAASEMSAVLNVDINGMEHEEEANELGLSNCEPEPSRAELDSSRAGSRASNPNFGLFSKKFVDDHGAQLVITTVCWLVLDVSFYSLNVFMKDILINIRWFGYTTTVSPLEQTRRLARMQALVALCGNLPGYFLAVAFVDRIGRVKIQLLGFTMMSIFMLGIAISHWANTNGQFGFVALYACILFFANFGPNSTTFIIPVEIFPTRLRATCHGISGAGGKVGAIVGVLGFGYFWILHRQIVIWMIILIGCNIVGFVFTWFLPEPKGRSLEELSRDTVVVEPPENPAIIAAGADDEIHTV